MDTRLVISDLSFAYLYIQRGNISDLYGEEWYKAYHDSLYELFDQIVANVPMVHKVIDIGSGLGGIDVLLHKHFDCDIVLFDGEGDPSKVRKPYQTFSSRSHAGTFMKDNGVRSYMYMSPQSLRVTPADLVLSINSWCFHYAPSTYMNWADQCMTKHMIVDIRNDGRAWRDQMEKKFGKGHVIRSYPKFDRVLYKRK